MKVSEHNAKKDREFIEESIINVQCDKCDGPLYNRLGRGKCYVDSNGRAYTRAKCTVCRKRYSRVYI